MITMMMKMVLMMTMIVIKQIIAKKKSSNNFRLRSTGSAAWIPHEARRSSMQRAEPGLPADETCNAFLTQNLIDGNIHF